MRHHATSRSMARIPVPIPTGHLDIPQSVLAVPGRETLSARSTARFTWEFVGLLDKICPEASAFPGSHSPCDLREGMAAPPFMHTMSSWIFLWDSFQRGQEGIKAVKADSGVYLSVSLKTYSPSRHASARSTAQGCTHRPVPLLHPHHLQWVRAQGHPTHKRQASTHWQP